MRLQLLIIPSVLIFQVATAQSDSVSTVQARGTAPTPAAAASSTPVVPPVSENADTEPSTTRQTILEYKSVYEAETVEEEVKMAAERFNLTPSQQDIWLSAATDRRAVEKQTRENLDSSNAGKYDRHGVYMGLRTSLNTFHETITGYLTPTQKQELETDRLILQEKQKKIAKLPPPPPPPAPAVTVAPVDSAAIMAEESGKVKNKKSKKKKKSSAQ